MGSLGAPEIILIIIAILILFGGKKIPELMKGLGKGMKEFKDAKTARIAILHTLQQKKNLRINFQVFSFNSAYTHKLICLKSYFNG